ncbi:HAD family hydrolase [Pedobacter sp. BS3]|uniref:HAD family hydrolase n=1 Tax=Pedobacter sp. BS3 TaxID=2567937 RepID=UPI0011EE8425|nr:HAD family hydrolase [Pedobacter sp. BS3]TZF83239.1 HAD family hydrolase [Pedobacter sp. BS3]
MSIKPDSIIFDMDGTLWDPMNVYTEAWNRGFLESGLNRPISRAELMAMMGWEKQKVMDKLLPGYDTAVQEKAYLSVSNWLTSLMNEKDGVIYEGVQAGLAQLAKKYKLFIVSNCPEGIIRLFMKRAGIEQYITDEMAHGVNLQPKSYNIKLLMDKYQLKRPVYVGDTNGDSEQSRLAGIPFVFMSYGFGTTERYDMKFEDFSAFTDYFMRIV